MLLINEMTNTITVETNGEIVMQSYHDEPWAETPEIEDESYCSWMEPQAD